MLAVGDVQHPLVSLEGGTQRQQKQKEEEEEAEEGEEDGDCLTVITIRLWTYFSFFLAALDLRLHL